MSLRSIHMCISSQHLFIARFRLHGRTNDCIENGQVAAFTATIHETRNDRKSSVQKLINIVTTLRKKLDHIVQDMKEQCKDDVWHY
jgi:hypothetical protein